MTTLAANKSRAFEGGKDTIEERGIPAIAADIIYEGSAVGVVDASGHGRPLIAGDRFAGFANAMANNAAGAAAALDIDLRTLGKVEIPVTGVAITDKGQPVYASDDDTFTLNPAAGSFIGFVHRFVSPGVAVVSFDVDKLRDPWGHYSVRETLSGTKVFDAEDSGKLFCCDAGVDNAVLTLPAIATGLSGITILAIGAFGSTKVLIDPAAADMILGPDITGADNKDLILTKATQRRGDFATLIAGDADGYMVTALRGAWSREA